MYYEYSQNNSGGWWDFSKDKGITISVWIEADSVSDSVQVAESVGIYFDSDYQRDCRCCGQRWDEPWSDKGDNLEKILHILDYSCDKDIAEKNGCSVVCIHAKDGKIHWINSVSELEDFMNG